MSNVPHVVLAAAPAWSHLRTLSVLAAKLVAERQVVVTFVVMNWMNVLGKVEAEVARSLRDVESPKGTFRALAIGEPSSSPDIMDMLKIGSNEVEPLWEAFQNQSMLTCRATSKTFPGAAPPSVAILDGFLYAWYSVAKKILPKMPILAWASGTSTGHALICLPPKYGGRPSRSDAPPSGNTLVIPGLPKMYDWEFVPQDVRMGEAVLVIEDIFARATHEADGIATPCTTDFDGEEALGAFDEWLAETGRVAYNFGPLMPFKPGTTDFSLATLDAEMKTAPPGVGEAIMTFLDKALSTYGKESVVYICFGSFFWPGNNIEHLWALLEALSQRGIPFVLSQGSPFAQIPDHIRDLYNSTEKALIVPWSPQQSVLAHKAVGWFVTHGGAGGTMDAVTQGVPMIGWPFIGDQPGNIAYLTHIADVAFTFYEARTGELGLKPILATGKTPTGTLDAFKEEVKQLLDDMAGEAGARKRRNVQKRKADLARSWGDGGRSRQVLEAFCAKHGL